MTFITFFFSIVIAHAQVLYKMPDCSTLDDLACHKAKVAEGIRVNKESDKVFKAALPTCSPIKSVTYLFDKHAKTNELHGKVDGKCKMTILTHLDPSALQTCNFDDKAMSLMVKDPKTYTDEENIDSLKLFMQQCTSKFLDPKVQAEHEKILAVMKKDMIEKMQAESKKLKANCQAGDKEGCTEYEANKKDMTSYCSNPDFQDVCKALEGI